MEYQPRMEQCLTSCKFLHRTGRSLASIAFLLATGSAMAQQHAEPLTTWVDPYIGVDWGGNTFIGSVVPFGMVKLGPDMESFDHRGSGFGYSSDGAILGFSHTHLSGAQGKYGNILVQPVTGACNAWQPGLSAYGGAGVPRLLCCDADPLRCSCRAVVNAPRGHPSLYLSRLAGCAPDPRHRALPEPRQSQRVGGSAFRRRRGTHRIDA